MTILMILNCVSVLMGLVAAIQVLALVRTIVAERKHRKWLKEQEVLDAIRRLKE